MLVGDGFESYFPDSKTQTLAMIAAQGAIAGRHAPAAALLRALLPRQWPTTH